MGGVNENSSGYLEVSFRNKDNEPDAPASVSYRIDCLTNNVEVRADTPVTPAAVVVIPLTTADNAIIDQANERERRLVTVTAVYGADDALVDEFSYYVKNLVA